MNKNLIIGLLAIVIAGSLGFFVGSRYPRMRTEKFVGIAGEDMVGSFGKRIMMRGDAKFAGKPGIMGTVDHMKLTGEVTKIDGKTVTVKFDDDTTKTVLIEDSVPVNTYSVGNRDTIKVGSQISVFGTTNADDSLSAFSVQVSQE